MPIFLTIRIKCIWSVANLLCFIYSYVYINFFRWAFLRYSSKRALKKVLKPFISFLCFHSLFSSWMGLSKAWPDSKIWAFTKFFFYFGWFLDGFLVYFHLTCLEDALSFPWEPWVVLNFLILFSVAMIYVIQVHPQLSGNIIRRNNNIVWGKYS
jgi:hypothetical protein